MKSIIKLILVISLLCVPLLSKSYESESESSYNQQNQQLSQKNKIETETSPVQQKKLPNHKRQVRFTRFTVKDTYEKIKKMQEEDKKELEFLEEKRTKKIEEKVKIDENCKKNSELQDKQKIVVETEEIEISRLTKLKVVYEDNEQSCMNSYEGFQRNFISCKFTEAFNVQKLTTENKKQIYISGQLKIQNQKLLDLEKKVEQAKKDLDNIKLQLTNQNTKVNEQKEFTQQSQNRCIEIQASIKKQKSECTEKNTKFQQTQYLLNEHIKTRLNDQIKSKTLGDEGKVCKNNQNFINKEIGDIQQYIVSLKIRICKYFNKNASLFPSPSLPSLTVSSESTESTKTKTTYLTKTTEQTTVSPTKQNIMGLNGSGIPPSPEQKKLNSQRMMAERLNNRRMMTKKH